MNWVIKLYCVKCGLVNQRERRYIQLIQMNLAQNVTYTKREAYKEHDINIVKQYQYNNFNDISLEVFCSLRKSIHFEFSPSIIRCDWLKLLLLLLNWTISNENKMSIYFGIKIWSCINKNWVKNPCIRWNGS